MRHFRNGHRSERHQLGFQVIWIRGFVSTSGITRTSPNEVVGFAPRVA
jgi:hypothetical protein